MDPEKIVLVFSDRDGTITSDKPELNLGSAPSWREQIMFLPGVIEGIKLINSIPNTKFIIVSNQSGVARADEQFRELTEQRMWEVDREIVDRLARQGARIDASFYCPYVSHSYAERVVAAGGKIHTPYVQNNHPLCKPRIGMLKLAAERFGLQLGDVRIKIMIGDRISDIETGRNAWCTSIFIDAEYSHDYGKTEKIRNFAERRCLGDILFARTFFEGTRTIELMAERPPLEKPLL